MIQLNNKLVTKFYVLDVNITNQQTYQNDILKNAKVVIVNWTTGGWAIHTIHLYSGYTLNTYNGSHVGAIYNSALGTLKYQYASDSSIFTIDKILVMK